MRQNESRLRILRGLTLGIYGYGRNGETRFG